MSGKAFQVKAVIHDGTVFAQNADIGGIGIAADERAGKNPQGSIGKANLGRFQRRIFVIIPDHRRSATHFHQIGIQHKTGHVHRMTARQNKSTAGLLRLLHPTTSLAPEPVIHIGQKNPTEFPFTDQALLHLHQRIETQNQPHHAAGATRTECRNQTRKILFPDRHRLLQKHMLAGLCSLNGFFRMLIIRCADRYNIHTLIQKKLLKIPVNRRLNTEFGLFGLNTFQTPAAQADQFTSGIAQVRIDMPAGYPAASPYRTT